MKNVVDVSAWMEYFSDGPNAYYFAPAIEDIDRLIVPAVTLYGVVDEILGGPGEADALEAAAVMQQGRIVPLDAPLALTAAKLRRDHRLTSTGSITLATAEAHHAMLWTQDERLAGVKGVRYVRERRTARGRR